MHRRPPLSALDRALEQLDHRLEPLARPCAFLLVARFGRTDAKTTRRQPARHGDGTLDRENESEREG